MTLNDFENTMLTFLRREPFRPFIVELGDGEQLMVTHPDDMFYHGGGTGMYMGPRRHLSFVDCENVRQFLDLVPQPVS